MKNILAIILLSATAPLAQAQDHSPALKYYSCTQGDASTEKNDMVIKLYFMRIKNNVWVGRAKISKINSIFHPVLGATWSAIEHFKSEESDLINGYPQNIDLQSQSYKLTSKANVGAGLYKGSVTGTNENPYLSCNYVPDFNYEIENLPGEAKPLKELLRQKN